MNGGGGAAGRGMASGGANGGMAGGGGAGGGMAGGGASGGAGAGGLAAGGATTTGTGSGGAAGGVTGAGGASTGGRAAGGDGGHASSAGGASRSPFSIAGAVSSGPTASREVSSSVIDVYAIGQGPDFFIQHATVTEGGSSIWDTSALKPPGKPVGQPAVAVHDGRRELVVLSDGAVYYSYNQPDHPWGTWTPLGDGNVTGGVSVCLFDIDRLDVFARGPGPDHLVWHSLVSGTQPWTFWESNAGAPPGGLRGPPVALSRRRFELDLVGQSDADGRLYHTHYDFDLNWTPWTALGDLSDTVEISPALSFADPDILDIWARGPDGQLLRTSFVGSTAPAAAKIKWDAAMTTSTASLMPGSGFYVLPALDQRLNIFIRSAPTSQVVRLLEAPPPTLP
jgi:hypothetical protein